MRTKLQTELDLVTELMVATATTVREAIETASTALLTADADRARSVIADDARIDEFCLRIEDSVRETTVCQAPVATDLRAMFAALHITADLERMGDLARHVAETALRSHPRAAVPADLAPVFEQMSDVASRMAAKMVTVLSEPDVGPALELGDDDNAMDDLHRELLARLLDPAWSHGTQAAVDAALLGRFYERYADHAVAAGRRIAFFVTGEPVSR